MGQAEPHHTSHTEHELDRTGTRPSRKRWTKPNQTGPFLIIRAVSMRDMMSTQLCAPQTCFSVQDEYLQITPAMFPGSKLRCELYKTPAPATTEWQLGFRNPAAPRFSPCLSYSPAPAGTLRHRCGKVDSLERSLVRCERNKLQRKLIPARGERAIAPFGAQMRDTNFDSV